MRLRSHRYEALPRYRRHAILLTGGSSCKGYDADWIRDLIEDQDCTAHIPPRRHRYDGITYSKRRYKQRNLIERCFNKLKQFRHIAMRFDRNPLNYLAMIKLASTRLWLRAYESAA